MQSHPYLSRLAYVRHGLGCDCTACTSQLGADPVPPSDPPAGSAASTPIPPPDAVPAVRSQAAEVFRRAVWEAAGPEGWDDDARRAWIEISTLPALRSVAAQPGEVSAVVADWLQRAVSAVPTTWTTTADPRATAAGSLSIYATRVLEQLPTWNPIALYQTGLAWRYQAAKDRASGYYDRAATAVQEGVQAVADVVKDAAPGFGFGAVLGVGAVLAIGAVLVAPEATTAAVYRAGRGIKQATKGRR